MNELKELPFWNILTESEKNRFSETARIRSIEKRESVYTANKGMSSMHFVLDGRVKVCRYFGDMREIILDLVPHGQFASFQPILDVPDEVEYAECVKRSVIVQVNARIVKNLMEQNAGFSSFMFQQLANRYNKINSRLSLVHPTVLIRKQIVTLLLELAANFGRSVGEEVIIEHGLSQHEMACMILRTRQSVTGVLRKLKRANLINYTRTSILVRDMEKLKRWPDLDIR